jgi:hypothetical protein
MHRSTIQWLIFASLFLTTPALLFMVQAVILMPAVFMLGGILYMLPKIFAGGHTTETISFIGFFLFHLLCFSGLYWLVSWLLAKLLCLIKKPGARTLTSLFIAAGVASLAFFPVYGSGGHGPMRWTNLAGLCADFNRSYTLPVTLIVYGGSLGLFAFFFAFNHWRISRRKKTADDMLQEL